MLREGRGFPFWSMCPSLMAMGWRFMNALSHPSSPPPEFSERRTRETAVRSVSHRLLIGLNGRPTLKGCKQAVNIKGLEVLLLFDAWYPFLQAIITFHCIEHFGFLKDAWFVSKMHWVQNQSWENAARVRVVGKHHICQGEDCAASGEWQYLGFAHVNPNIIL